MDFFIYRMSHETCPTAHRKVNGIEINIKVLYRLAIFVIIIEILSWGFHDAFYKDYAFPPYPDPFLECQGFVNLAIHFIRARNSLILSKYHRLASLFTRLIAPHQRIRVDSRYAYSRLHYICNTNCKNRTNYNKLRWIKMAKEKKWWNLWKI